MIYLNNAGTTWPKPESVNQAIADFNNLPPDEWLAVFKDGVDVTTSFFGIRDSARFLFTQSCTQSIAVAFSDLAWEPGDRLIISSMEHHALSRWYYKLQQERGVSGAIIPRAADGPVDLVKLELELEKGAKMVAMSMASNVTGEILPFERVVALAKKYGALCLLDGAQTAGLIPINISELAPDFFVFAGHKAPFGPQGIGGLYISESVSMVCPSAACEIVPGEKKVAVFPTYCDTGSAPMQAIAGLSAGIKWLENKGWRPLTTLREQLVDGLRSGLASIDGISVVGSTIHGEYTNAVSIKSETVPLAELNEKLWKQYQIKGSFGFQCAPLAHEALGTDETGTLRFSVGPFSTEADVALLLTSLDKLM